MLLLAATLCVAAVPSLFAQTAGTGALTGTIKDSTGAVIPDATVTVTSKDTGQSRTATTTPNGSYQVGLLPPGNYSVKIAANGFQTVEIPSATVTVTETGTLDETLQVGSQTQEVTVQSSVETVQTASSALGTVVGSQSVTGLPLNTRNYTNLLGMSSGVNGAVQNATALGKGATAYAVNGGGTQQSTYLQDGAPVNNWFSFNTPGDSATSSLSSFAVPNPDTIQEFKILTATYDAGYGRDSGANINVVTKTGTNQFHGSVFEFFRNTVFNANDWFRNFTHGSRLTLNQNQPGGVFGGPIKKDKLFFFVAYQETQQKNGIAANGYSTVTLPPIPTGDRGTCPVGWTTLAQCNPAGQAFVPALGAAICPATHSDSHDKTNNANSIQVACNGSNINPVAISLLQLKIPNGSYLIPGSTNGGYQVTTFSDPALFYDHQGMGNFDYLINPKNTLSGRYTYETDPTIGNFAVGLALPGAPVYGEKTDHAALLKLTSILSNNMVNEFRVSYQRNITRNHELNSFTNSSVGIADMFPSSPVNNLSFFQLSGLFDFGSYYFSDVYIVEDQYEWADQLSWTHGKHSVRTGFEYEDVAADQTFPGLSIGAPTIPSFPDFLIGRAGCPAGTFVLPPGVGCNKNNPGTSNGSTASNILNPGTVDDAGGGIDSQQRVTFFNAFVQDDIKVNSRLTINLGLRWEYDGLPSEKYGRLSDIWPSVVNTVPLPGGACGCFADGTLVGFVVAKNYQGPLLPGLLKTHNYYETPNGPPKDDFAPRFGFAWKPLASNDRWVMRGGFAVFYDVVPGATINNTLFEAEPTGGTPTATAAMTLANPWVLPPTLPGPPGTFGWSPRWVNTNPLAPASSNISQTPMTENFTTPMTYQWSLNTQYEFLPSWVLELGYVGSHGVHQFVNVTFPYNIAPLYSAANPDPITGVTTNTAANAIIRAPYLGFATTTQEYATFASFKYNSLQATVRKEFSHGLRFQAAYTWSRGFNTATYGINTAPYVIEAYELNAGYHPQRFIVNYTWDLPFGHHEGLLDKFVDGWDLSGVTTVQNGTPLTPVDSRGGAVYGAPTAVSTGQYCAGMGPANLATSGSLDSKVISGLTGGAGYLNGRTQGVFCTPPAIGSDGSTGFGDAGLSTILGPGQFNWDVSLSKLTTVGGLREDATLLFRAEFYNLFNHPQFSNPNLSVSSAAFGQITTMSVNPRLIQLGVKYIF